MTATFYVAGQHRALRTLGLKTADAIFPKLKTDALGEIQRRLARVFKLKTPSGNLVREITRLFKDPLKSVRFRRL